MSKTLCILRALGVAAIVLLFMTCSGTQAPRTPTRPPAVTTPSAAATQEASGSSDLATVWIYRPKAFMGMALRPTVMLNGKDLVNVGNGRAFKAQFPPGKHSFVMDDGRSGAELDLQAGQVYYFKMDIVPGFWKGGGRLTLVAAEQGSFEIKDLKPVPDEEIEDPAFRTGS